MTQYLITIFHEQINHRIARRILTQCPAPAQAGTFWGCDTELVSIDSNSTDAAVDLRSIKGESAIALSADTLIYC